MKYKLTLVIVISLLLIAGGIAETIFVAKTFGDFGHMVDEVSAREEYALEDVRALQDYWEQRADWLEITVPHVQLTEINVTLGELVGAVRNEDYDSASALLLRIREYVDRIGTLYGFSFRNIF